MCIRDSSTADVQGELKQLDSQVPVLYMDFPLGRLKWQGTIVYPKNRYLSLKPTPGNKLLCEDVFEHIVRSHLGSRSIWHPLLWPTIASFVPVNTMGSEAGFDAVVFVSVERTRDVPFK